MKKNLKCLALFIGLIGAAVVFSILLEGIKYLAVALLGEIGAAIAAVVFLLILFIVATHLICSDWD